MDAVKIGLSAGDASNALFEAMTAELSDAQLLALQIDQETDASEGLAGEPVILGLIVAGSAIGVSALVRVIERVLEHRQERWVLRLVVEEGSGDPALQAALAELASKYADVSIANGIAKEAWGRGSLPGVSG